MSNYPTRKSHKSLLRDRPKHSGKLLAHTLVPRKGGVGGGAGRQGRLGEELGEDGRVLDPNDPAYGDGDDYGEYDDYSQWQFEHARESASAQFHADRSAHYEKFQSSLRAYAEFKACVRSAVREYLSSHDALEFEATITERALPLFLPDLPAIVIKHSFDRSDADRATLCSLLSALHKSGLITASHWTHSIRKLTYALPELTLDVPAARTYLKEFAQFGFGSGMLQQTELDAIDEYEQCTRDAGHFARIKQQIAQLLVELFVSEDLSEAESAVKEIAMPASIQYEVVKAVIRSALDRGNRQREVASQFLSTAAMHGILTLDDCEKGLSVLLERVEDISLDVKDSLPLLATFVARAVFDEWCSPAFLARVDVTERDLGAQVLEQAHELLMHPKHAELITRCWMGERKTDKHDDRERKEP